MENLEERLVGYRPGLERSTQFGLGYLRLAREMEPFYQRVKDVVTPLEWPL